MTQNMLQNYAINGTVDDEDLIIGDGVYNLILNEFFNTYNKLILSGNRGGYTNEQFKNDMVLIINIKHYVSEDIAQLKAHDIIRLKKSINAISINIDKDYIIDLITYNCEPIRRFLKNNN